MSTRWLTTGFIAGFAAGFSDGVMWFLWSLHAQELSSI